MTLEDFFTLPETKDGLSILTRVEELMFALEEQKECVLNSSGDASKQWSIVVGTLAATENKDCLNRFVYLNGLSFLNQWLLQSLKCDKDVSEDMSALLAMLEKLSVDREKLTVSGIRSTIEHLLGHKSLDIKEKAKRLSDKWNDINKDISCNCSEDRGTSLNDQPKPSDDLNTTKDGVHAVCPVFSISTAEGGTANCEVKSICAESQLSNVTKCSDNSQMAIAEDAKISVSKLIATTSSNSVIADAALGDLKSSGSTLVSNSFTEKSVTEESSICPVVGFSSTCRSPVYESRDDDHRDIYVVREVSEGTKEMEVEVSTKDGSPCRSSKKESSIISSSSGLSDTLPSSQDNSKGSQGVDIVIPNDSSKAEKTKAIGQMDQRSGLGLEYEELDALEVARQVALEVEREVVDYREPFCSSPEANSGKTMEINSPVAKLEQSLIKDLDNMLPSEKDLSDDASSPKNPKYQIPESAIADPQEREQPLESPKLASITHGSAGESDKNKWNFDLNEDICTEEFNCSTDLVPSVSVSLSAPKAIFATSKGVPSLPVAPLQFEGEMGWKGSAATSAFRPASPRKTPDCEKASSVLNQKQNFLEIDLNVAESEHDMAVDPILAKQMPAFSGLPSGDSSLEVSSRRAERLLLDLNRLGDEDMSANPSSCYRIQHHNGEQSLSSASSSSPRQRDFDLNDNLCFIDAGGSSKVPITNYGESKFNDPVRIMSNSRRDVERKDYLTQAHPSFLGSGLNMEAVMTARQAQPYAYPPPYYGYSGYPAGPIMPIPPSLHGPGNIPYMVDPRGVSVVPHILGSVVPNASHSSGPPFLISGAPSGMNGVGPSRSGFDLNSCMTSVESGSREGGSFRQLFIDDQNALMEEKTRISSQPSDLSLSLKRKEPECGWETYAAGYNPMMSWR